MEETKGARKRVENAGYRCTDFGDEGFDMKQAEIFLIAVVRARKRAKRPKP